MKIVALGGSGGMGRAALHHLADLTRVDELVVADLAVDAAREVAARLRDRGQPATAAAIDVNDGAALRALLADADLVLNTVGPYYRFGVPVLSAAIDTQTRYIDICDDAQPTLDMLELDEAARAAGVTAVIGAGASPGVMNVFARIAADGMERVDDLIVGWTLNSTRWNWDMSASSSAAGGDAALMHFYEQFSGTVPVVEDGQVVQRRTRRAIGIDVPGLGRGTGYVVGHPEPVTLPRTVPTRGRSMSICLASSDRIEAVDRIAGSLERGETTMRTALELTRSGNLPARDGGTTPFADGGDLPIYFVVLTGQREGRDVTQFIGCRHKPAVMQLSTGVPLALVTALTLGRDLPHGVHPLDSVLERRPFLDELAPLWGVAPSELYFTGSIPTNQASVTGIEDAAPATSR